MFIKRFFSIVFVICFLFTGVSFGRTIVKMDNFGETTATPFDPFADETINADTVINTITNDKSYASYTMSNSESKLFVKNLKLHTEPTILSTCPLGTHSDVLYTGKANNIVLGISNWYSMAGIMYDFGALCDTLAVTFNYLNTRSVAAGKVVLIMQEVDENNLILWENTFTCAGYSTSYKSVWRNLNFTKERLASYLGGHKFNRVWLVETELYLDKVGGAYFDDIVMTATNSDPEPEPEPEPEPGDRELPPAEDPDPITPPTVDDGVIEDIADEIMSDCPCNAEWRNHGHYVSCVVKSKIKLLRKHQERLVNAAVSIVEAAKSNCGKK